MSFEKIPFDKHCIYCNKKSTLDLDYSFIDIAYCINLKSRTDRYKKAVKEFHKVGLCQKVLFYRTTKPDPKKVKKKGFPNLGTYRCWESHRSVIKDAVNKNLKNCLVFEDDIIFHSKRYIKNYIKNFENLPKNWDMYYLGHSPFLGYHVKNDIYRVYSTGGHAYLINKDFMKKIVETKFGTWKFISGDQYAGIDAYHLQEGYCYASYPMAAYQSGSYSDNNNRKEMKHIKNANDYSRDRKIKKEKFREFFCLRVFPNLIVFILILLLLLALYLIYF